ELQRLDGDRVAIIDTRPWSEYRAGALPKSLSIPLSNAFPTEAGSFIEPDCEITLITPPHELDGVIRALVRVGLDHITGWARPEAVRAADGLQTLEEIDVVEAQRRLAAGEWRMLDVRRASEAAEVRIPDVPQIAHTRLAAQLDDLPRDKPLVVHCRSGARSARACSLLRRHGLTVANLAGGILAWEQAAPVERSAG
ncbi:MAG: rhodanese-like domain-containing protein, partial [Planctomycetota bacterium]